NSTTLQTQLRTPRTKRYDDAHMERNRRSYQVMQTNLSTRTNRDHIRHHQMGMARSTRCIRIFILTMPRDRTLSNPIQTLNYDGSTETKQTGVHSTVGIPTYTTHQVPGKDT